jgi:hypothetical protein
MVTTTYPDGTTETLECKPGSYVLVLPPDLYVAGEQIYANGTRTITLKRQHLAPDDEIPEAN